MGLFRKSPPPRPTLQRQVPSPWDPPESEFAAIVPIDTLPFAPSEQAAIAITGITAYTSGFENFMARHIRPGIPGLDEDPTPEMLSRSRTDPLAAPFFSLLLSDGTKVISGRPPRGIRADRADSAVARRRRLYALAVLPVVGLAVAAQGAAGVHLPVADVRDHRNAGRHRRTANP